MPKVSTSKSRKKFRITPQKVEMPRSEFRIMIDYMDGETTDHYYFEPHFSLDQVRQFAEECAEEGMVELVTLYHDGTIDRSFTGIDQRSDV